MTFEISKFASHVAKSMNFVPLTHNENLTFKLDMNHLSSTNQYTYLGIPFDESLDLEPIIAKMNSKKKYTVNSFFRSLTNRKVPFYFKTHILASFVLSSVLYYAPLTRI
jgi:hypothetical protein